jgi:preprotein translocase SecE subunit
VATTDGQRDDLGPDRELELEPPSPLEHAAPDVELADAQLALGRPELAGDGGGSAEPDDYDEGEEYEDELVEDTSDGSGGDSGGIAGRELGAHGGAAAVPRARPAHRLIGFLQGSWRELQRVQWPDRRQVVQATGVVIGFVLVASVYLGVADTLATRLMNFILK